MLPDTVINKIKLEHLNTKCLIQVSKFARILHRINGTVLKLQDKNIVQQVVHQSHINDNHDLQTIYESLMSEINQVIVNIELEHSLLSSSSGYSIKTKHHNLN